MIQEIGMLVTGHISTSGHPEIPTSVVGQKHIVVNQLFEAYLFRIQHTVVHYLGYKTLRFPRIYGLAIF